MQTIKIQKISITDLKTDIIVNAANDKLKHGSGVCGYIFDAAGAKRLQDACDQIGYCPTGKAVITPGFDLCRYIVHAVGPKWQGGIAHEPQQLYSCYKASLDLAVKYDCHSIGFPLISAGIYGYPVDKAWRKAIQAVNDWFHDHEDYDIEVIFAVLNEQICKTGMNTLKEIMPSYSNASGQHPANSTDVTRDTLKIGNKTVKAVFFHLPEEPYGYFSNWYSSPFELDGIKFSSCEQYIMYRKCILFGDEESAKAVLATDDTQKQQDIGRKATGYVSAVWNGLKQAIAVRGLLAKFEQNEDLKKLLLDTGDAYLVECARTDHIWACGRRLDDDRRFDISTWDGENILGFALMEVREQIQRNK